MALCRSNQRRLLILVKRSHAADVTSKMPSGLHQPDSPNDETGDPQRREIHPMEGSAIDCSLVSIHALQLHSEGPSPLRAGRLET